MLTYEVGIFCTRQQFWLDTFPKAAFIPVYMSSSIVDEQLVSGYKRKWIHVAVTTILSPIQDTNR